MDQHLRFGCRSVWCPHRGLGGHGHGVASVVTLTPMIGILLALPLVCSPNRVKRKKKLKPQRN